MSAGPHELYLRAWRERYASGARERARLVAAAREVAGRAARRLRELGATRVYLYGSLAHGHAFDDRSDVDLGVIGMAPERLEAARPDLEALAQPFRLDVRALEPVQPEFRATVTAYGEVLA